jgi:hypothetical protein
MSAKLLTELRLKPNVSAEVWDLYVDNNANIDNLTVTGTANLPSGSGLPQPVPVNKILRSNNLSVVEWGQVPHGTSRQLLQTDSLGITSEWTSSISLPGSISCTGGLDVGGASTFYGDGLFQVDLQVNHDLNILTGDVSVVEGDLDVTLGQISTQNCDILGNLKFNSVAGVTGQFLKKTSTTSQSFANIVAADITPGTNGQYLQTSGGVSIWGGLPTYSLPKMRFYNNTIINVNGGIALFNGGVQQYNVGSPFTFDSSIGVFHCNITGYYTWNFRTMLSTHDAQSKFIIGAADIYATCLTDYVAGLTTTQPFSFTTTLPATAGDDWELDFYSIGIGGVLNTSGDDPNFPGCPTTILEIIGTGF